jgi:hypothetical protein
VPRRGRRHLREAGLGRRELEAVHVLEAVERQPVERVGQAPLRAGRGAGKKEETDEQSAAHELFI